MLDEAPRLASYATAEFQCSIFGGYIMIWGKKKKKKKTPRRITKETADGESQDPKLLSFSLL